MKFRDSKLISVLNYIKELEQTKLVNQYMENEYQNHRSRDLKLWRFLIKYHGKSSENAYLKYSIIDKFIFSGKITERNKSVHRLYQKIKTFMVTTTLEKDDLLVDWLFYKSLKEKGSNLLGTVEKEVVQKIDKREAYEKDSLYYFLAYQFYDLKHKNLVSDELKLDTKYMDMSRDSLTILYQEGIEKIEAEIRAIKEVNQENKEQATKEKALIESSAAVLEQKIKGMTVEINTEQFLALFEEVMENPITTFEKKSLHLQHFVNCLLGLFLRGNTLLAENWSLIVEYGFENKLFFNKGYLHIQHFVNMLSVVSQLDRKTTDRHDYLVRMYLKKLSKKDFKVGELMAFIFKTYKLKRYKKVVDFLEQNKLTRKSSFFIKIRVYSFQIRSLYPLRKRKIDTTFKIIKEDTKRVRKSLYTYRAYLKSVKGLNLFVNRNQLFVTYTLKVLNTKTALDLNAILKEIETKQLNYKSWIRRIVTEKLSEIEEGFTFK